MQLFDKANCVFGSLFVDDGCCNVSIKVSALPENWADKIACYRERVLAKCRKRKSRNVLAINRIT